MTEKTYLLMQPTEIEVFHAASRIYSALIQTQSDLGVNKSEMMRQAVTEAIELAQLTDDMVLCNGEPG